MQFDDTTYPGGNSGDGCIFFDSDDAGGFSDFAVCGSFIQNTTTGVVELQSAALYDCTGSEPNNDEGKRCRFTGGGGDGSRGIIAQDLDGDGVFESDGNGSLLGTPYDTTCSLTSSASDPFNGVGNHNTIGEQDPITDTQVTCTIYADELVELNGDVPSGVVVSNACSFTSPDPGSESKDCVVPAGSGFLQIVKNTTGGDATFDYTLDGDAFVSITTVGGTGSTNNLGVDGDSTFNLDEVVPAGWQLDSATCDNDDSPSTLTVGAANTVVCTFSNSVSVEAPQPRVIKGTIDGNDTVDTLDEPGGQVTIDVTVRNNAAFGPGDATLTALSDDIYGDITTTGHDGITSTTCAIGGVVVGGGSYTCSFTVDVSSAPGTITDTVTATLENDVDTVSDSDQANVVINDVASAIEMIKTATPDNVDEPSGSVTYTFTVNNLSTADSVTINSLDDSIYGDIADGANPLIVSTTCAVPSPWLLPVRQGTATLAPSR
jgi:hypothetical protein